MTDAAMYGALARLLEYPSGTFGGHVDGSRALLRGAPPAARDSFAAFAAGTESMAVAALEELYIRTFDFNPDATLDLGWQLFAEDYNRGLFLAKLRGESQRLGVAEDGELPDHLPHVLRLIARMEPAQAADLTATCVAPAIEKAMNALDESNPYRHLLRCVSTLLEATAGPRQEVNPA